MSRRPSVIPFNSVLVGRLLGFRLIARRLIRDGRFDGEEFFRENNGVLKVERVECFE